ncbi:MAG: hypothetical protein JSU70_02070 [Phycisphaerales bacterium]|nr:MAG: hypothetical protein JSU70_02070 [Phycisphaerales bacterium]
MEEQDKERIQEIISGMQCPKDFECVEGGFENMCKARDFGDEATLHCLEETSSPCQFAVLCDYGLQIRFCHCPLRVYLAKHLGK